MLGLPRDHWGRVILPTDIGADRGWVSLQLDKALRQLRLVTLEQAAELERWYRL